MEPISLAMTRTMTRICLVLLAPRRRDERGDVPGWVMITVMTAGLVVAITAIAKPQLQSMLSSALNQVK
jgi:hypothetical protein